MRIKILSPFIKIVLFVLFISNYITPCVAQGITNFGNLYIFSGGNVGTAIPFTNSAISGTDYLNNGNFFTTSNFINNKSAMPAGAGTTSFNGSTTQFISGTNTPQFNSIIINNNIGGLQPLDQNYTINIAGNWVNNGVFNHQKGTLLFNGSAPTIISGTAPKNVFYNFIMAKPSSLTLAQNVDLINFFAFKNVSNAILSSGGYLTIKSSDSVTAQIADITDNNTLSGNSISGNVTIERYLFPRLAWRFLATPITILSSPTITQSWRENYSSITTSTGYGTRITGPGLIGVNGVDAYTQRGSLKYYDDINNNWIEISATNIPVANNKGYFVFVRGDRSVGVGAATGPTTLRMTGNVRMNNQSFSTLANRFQSVGNPFASRIDFRNITKTAVVDAFTIWEPKNVGLYNVGGYENYVQVAGEYWLNGITTGGSAKKKNFIESGEAFFIQSVTGGSITIKEQDKINGSALVSRAMAVESRQNALTPTMDISLFIKNSNDSLVITDGVSLKFDDTFNNNIDNYDVKKISNTYDNLCINSNSINLVVESRTMPVETDIIKLNLNGTRLGRYVFTINPILLQHLNVDAFFVDKFLNTRIPLSLINENNVDFVVTADAASKAADRFMIVFKAITIVPFSFVKIDAQVNLDNTHYIPFTIANERSIINYQLERSDHSTGFLPINSQLPLYYSNGSYNYLFIDSFPLSSNNYYRIKATDINGQIQFSDIVKIVQQKNKPLISVHPTIINDKILSINFLNSVGNYTFKLISLDGKVVMQKQVFINSLNEIKTFTMNTSLVAGIYFVQINGEHTKALTKVYIK
ncbi:T9SS type A sorting domain-containing protein [Ferruginibacter yonginensis]|uniref:T9SS type A sorting domain-containing protein n=1 Tax=Ferruginibacter yonginensis TaxID=1310416 RepID=A0ABV8QVI0_9BACT